MPVTEYAELQPRTPNITNETRHRKLLTFSRNTGVEREVGVKPVKDTNPSDLRYMRTKFKKQRKGSKKSKYSSKENSQREISHRAMSQR